MLSAIIDRYFIKQPRLREAVTKLLYGNRDRDVDLFQHAVRINELRENGYLRASRRVRTLSLFRDEALTMQHLMLFVRPGMTFVDVGANIGIFSILMSDVRRIYPDFGIVAFEANPDTYSRLTENARRFGFTARNVAAGAQDHRATFIAGAVSHVATIAEKRNSYSVPGRQFEMDVRRLDGLDLAGRLFLKIDVEGQEMAVLQGAERLFADDRVDAVFIDACPDLAELRVVLEAYGLLVVDGASLEADGKPDTLLALRPAAYPGLAALEGRVGGAMREAAE
ncbi:FkbM family methyltransferase [Sphingomonas sp.]|uniref:FkbM family methyltransferase n=1 Tax=Sphingomonas sp. TaxID=28214 RepID=UPI001AFFCE78|nr:FkbM family methyltransferase [Sphingomonas sp.]MBO9712085.1 FkbM family methyltransferase [Sphingomonas sp.]